MLYIIRHGKTDWNAIFKLQGSTDIPLNEEGRQMARLTREEALPIHFDVCYSSPLSRARETAEIILEGRSIPIYTDDRIKEMCFGEYEGVEKVIDNNIYPIVNFFNDPDNYVPDKGAESFEELFKRTGEFLEEVIYPELKKGKDILIVGHGAMNCSLICQIKNYPLKDFWKEMTGNCKLMKVIE